MESASSSGTNSNWTARQNELFEVALEIYDKETPDRWTKIANIVGGTTEEEVKRRYQLLVDDTSLNESVKVPASMESTSFSGTSSNWTAIQNKLFELALSIYDKETPDRWTNIANIVGGTTEEEVKRRYQLLVDDISLIESGTVPLPDYVEGKSRINKSNKED